MIYGFGWIVEITTATAACGVTLAMTSPATMTPTNAHCDNEQDCNIAHEGFRGPKLETTLAKILPCGGVSYCMEAYHTKTPSNMKHTKS